MFQPVMASHQYFAPSPIFNHRPERKITSKLDENISIKRAILKRGMIPKADEI